VVVSAFGFRGAFFASAAFGVVALLTLALVRARPDLGDAAHRNRCKPPTRSLPIALAFAALALFHTAMFMGSIPLPIVLTTSLGGVESDVGLMFSFCAALEIIVMGALIWRPLKRGVRMAIVVGFAAFVAYFVALALARSVGLVFWAQILRAIGIALVSYLGIGFLQSLLPHRAGAAAALFSNAGQVGSVLAAVGVGALAQALGYASIFVACAILSAAGLAMVCSVRAEPD
jgi:SET family sugar efflux transporter-like MFS transporter